MYTLESISQRINHRILSEYTNEIFRTICEAKTMLRGDKEQSLTPTQRFLLKTLTREYSYLR